MADFTSRMPLTEGTNRVIADPAPVNGLATAVNWVTEALGGYTQLRSDEAARKRQAAAEAEKAMQKNITHEAFTSVWAAENAVLTNAAPETPTTAGAVELDPDPTSGSLLAQVPATAAAVFNDPTGVGPMEAAVPDGLHKAATSAGTQLASVTAAVDQRRMPAISITAALNAQFKNLSNKYPGYEEDVLDIWKKMGVDTNLFRAGKDAGDQLEEDRESRQRSAEADRKFEQDLFELGMKGLGTLAATGGADGGPMSREEVMSHGLRYSQQAMELEINSKRASIASSQATISKEQRAEVKEDANLAIRGNLMKNLWGDGAPVITMLQQGAAAIVKLPAGQQQAEFEKFAPQVHSMFENYVAQSIRVAMDSGYSGDVGTLERDLRSTFKRVEDLFSGDFSVFQSNNRALNSLQTNLKLELSESIPIFTALKEAGIDPSTMPGFMEGLATNTDLQKRLRSEIKGFNADFGRDRASEHLMEVVKLLRGQSSLADYTPDEARARLPDLYNTTQSIAKNYYRGLGGDPDMVINGVGEITLAANALAPASGANAHVVAVGGFGGTAPRAALIKAHGDKTADHPMVVATIQASRAASAHVLNNTQANVDKLNKDSTYFKLKFDARNGKYFIDSSAHKKALAAAQADAGRSIPTGVPGLITHTGVPSSLRNAKAPQEMMNWLKASNLALDNVIELGPYDPSTPKASELELRNYYGANIPLKSDTKNAPINPQKELSGILEGIQKTLDANLTAGNTDPGTGPLGRVQEAEDGTRTVKGMKGQTVSIPSPAAIAERFADNPNYQKVIAGAQAAGIPLDVISRLGFLESKFNHGGNNGAGAYGVMQVYAKAHDAEAQEMFGKEVKDLSSDENIQLGLKILADNYKRRGDWKAAVHDYIGRGDNDGNMKSKDYADIVAGGFANEMDDNPDNDEPNRYGRYGRF